MSETLYPHVHQAAQHHFELSDENRMIACSDDFGCRTLQQNVLLAKFISQ